jgi:uncharacterized protein DUF2252
MPRTTPLVPIVTATRNYEAWVGAQVPLVRADIVFKHEQMALGAFSFLRATFYRWMEQWQANCADLARAPKVLAVGDLHTENFGTWRDNEGRLIWGINDFDEAYPLAYTIDLVRLATSARLSIAAGNLQITPRAACAAILDGYHDGIGGEGMPFVLAEDHPVLRGEAESELRNPVNFWTKMQALPVLRNPSAEAVKLLRGEMHDDEVPRYVARRAGLGSLGHPRVVAIAEHRGGLIAREAKALVGSAAGWVDDPKSDPAIHYHEIVDGAVRCADPFLEVQDRWVVRRLAPDCSRIEFTVTTAVDQPQLLRSMGFETANVHLGSGKRKVNAVRSDLAKRDADWLKSSSKVMAQVTMDDQVAWHRAQTV